MTASDLADLFIEATSRMEFYWNFLVVFLTALLGWLFTSKRVFTNGERVVITLGYFIFALMNIQGLYGSYTFVNAIHADLLASGDLDSLPATRNALMQVDYAVQRQMMFWIHGFVAILVLAAIWGARRNET